MPPNPSVAAMLEIVWKLLLPLVGFLLGIFVKGLLDLELGNWIVRLFSWVPTRGLFRARAYPLAGDWNQTWHTDVKSFSAPEDRESPARIKQFYRYCYAEFRAQDTTYILLGQIHDGHLIGRWYDANDDKGYYGSFQLEIVSQSELRGKWLGHSKKSRHIRAGEWKWQRILPLRDDNQ